MPYRDRITELRRVRAAELLPNVRNWRTHPPRQRQALRGVLHEIGFAGALIARTRTDGRLELIDGHLRAESVAANDMVPVLVVDLDEAEANTLLAVLDPIASLAGRDDEQLAALMQQIETDNAEVQSLLDHISQQETQSRVGDTPPRNVPSQRDSTHEDRTHDGSRHEDTTHDDRCHDAPAMKEGRPQLRVVDVPESFQLLVDCRDEDDQRELDARLTADGYECRVLTL